MRIILIGVVFFCIIVDLVVLNRRLLPFNSAQLYTNIIEQLIRENNATLDKTFIYEYNNIYNTTLQEKAR